MAFLTAALGAGGAAGGIGSTIGTVVQIAGALIGAAAAFSAADDARKAGQYQKQVYDMNSQIAESNARRRIETGQLQSQEQDSLTRAMIGEQIAVQSASGLSLGGRSFILTRKAAAELGRKDALNLRNQAEAEAYNYKVEAVNQTASGRLAEMKGNAQAREYEASGLASFLQAGALVGSAFTTGSSRSYYRNPVPRTVRIAV